MASTLKQAPSASRTSAGTGRGTPAYSRSESTDTGFLRGKFVPPYREFAPVLPPTAETLTRLSMLPRLTAVCAPAGYGKTVLLSLIQERQAARGHRTVWVSLDDRDRSVNALLALLRSALALATDTPDPATGGNAARLPGHEAPEQKLLSTLNQLNGTTVLIIDNFHFCTDPQAGAALQQLLYALPPSCRLVVSSTSALPLDLVRAKLELGAQLIDAEHLTFDQDCIERMFSASGVNLPSDAIAQTITRRTEGWPAAARLLLVLSQSGLGVEQAVERFSGTDSDIASVLTRRVLAGFDPALVNFLYEIALLREFSAELATEVTGEPRAAEWIDMLVQRNVLIFPLDRTRRWLRMHTLLRQYLLTEGRSHIERERRKTLLERAARWHTERDDLVTAIDLALEAPSYVLASDCLERVGNVLVGHQGQLPRFIDWVEQLMAAGVPVALSTHAWYIWALCFSLAYEKAQRAIEAFDARLMAQPLSPEQAASFHKRLGLLRVVIALYLDDLDLVTREGLQWLANTSEQDALGVATVNCGTAIAAFVGHDFVSARRYAQTATGAIERATSPYGLAWVATVQALIEITQGDPIAADQCIERVKPKIVQALGGDSGVLGTMEFVHARALADQGRLAEAQAAARTGLRHAAQHGIMETTRFGLQACLSFWHGEDASPWSPVELASVVNRHSPRLARLFDAMLVRRLVQLGRLAEASFIAERQGWHTDGLRKKLAVDDEASEIVLARIELAMATGHQREAQGWIESRLAFAQSHAMRRELVELHLLAASGHARLGEDRLALRHLIRAIVTAARRQLVGPFQEQMGWISRLLDSHDDKAFAFTLAEEQTLLKRLRQAARPVAATDTPAAQVAPVQPLTPREVQFLDCLAQGLNNQQIADRAGLSVETVKWHLYNLYSKLSVKNRTAALAAARTLGLLAH